MRAIFINAKNRTVEEINLNPKNTLKSLQECVEGLIELAVRFDNRDDLFINEEGLLIQFPYGFLYGNYVFVGNGVIAGHNPRTGETTGATTDIKEVRKAVRWLYNASLHH